MRSFTDLWHGTTKYVEELVGLRPSAAPVGDGQVGAVSGGPRQVGPAAAPVPTTPVPTTPVQASVSRLAVAGVARPALQGLLAFALYLAVFLAVYARPLLGHLNVPNLRQYWTDPNFYLWSMQWWPYAIAHGINPLFSHQIGAPQGYNLAWASTTPSVGVLMWPVTAAFGVLVSYNVMLLLVPPASAWAAFIAARRLTSRFWASLLAGAVYGFCPYELVHNWQGQPNLTVIALLPLMLYLTLLWWDGTLRSVWFVCWMALAMALEFYTFNEAFFDMTAVLAGGLVIGFAVAERGARRTVARLAGLTAIAYAVAVAVAAPYLIYSLKHYQQTLSRQHWEFSLHLIRLILPWSDKVFGLGSLASYSARVGRSGVDDYLGLPLLIILLGLAVFAWRSRVTRLLAIGFVFVIALAVGPDLTVGSNPSFQLPWGGLWRLPIARSAEPSRFIVFAVLALAIALALFLAAPARNKLLLTARWCLGLLAVAAILFDTPTARQAVQPVPPDFRLSAGMHPANELPAFITDRMYRRYLRPGESVVILTARGNAGMLFQAAAGFYFRIQGGFINASLTPQNAIPHPVTMLTDPSAGRLRVFEDYARSSRLDALVVEQAWARPWMRDLSRVGMHGTSVGGVTIYPMAPWLASLAHGATSAATRPHLTRPHLTRPLPA